MQQITNYTSPLCYLPSGKLVCYKHGNIEILHDGKLEKRISVFKSKKERFFGKSKLAYRLLRLGVRAAEAIDENHIILSVGNMLFELDLVSGKLSDGYFCGEGIRPLVFTKVDNIHSIDRGIYFGGYLGNRDKNPVSVCKREDVDKWQIVYTFPQGEINHVHNIVSDPFRQCLWIFTGDFDKSAAIWKVTDNFAKVEYVVCNNQKYRGCVAYALPEGLLYATDAPFQENFIYLFNPDDLTLKSIYPLHGSCIYGCKWKDRYVFSSTVEGDGRNTSKMEFFFGRKRGGGIKDKYVHLYAGNMQNGFREIYKEKKDSLPYYTFQFGVFKFPYGENNGDALYFQPIATTKNDMSLLAIKENDLRI
jgi:hypothetical protein